METSGLGTINAIVSNGGKSISSGKTGSGFDSLLTGIMGVEPVLPNDSANITSIDMPKAELTDLIQYLQTTDIFKMENGSQLLGECANSGSSDVIKLIEEQLNLSSDELIQLLSKLHNSLNVNIEEQNVSIDQLKKDNKDEDQSDLIIALIQSIFSIQKQDMRIEPTKEFGQAMKAIKLFELLSAHKGSLEDQLKLKEFMKNISEKLELALNTGSTIDRVDFAKKTFQSLLNEQGGKTQADSEIAGKGLNKSETVNHQGFIQFQQMSKPEQLSLITSAGKPVSTEQLLEQFESILSRSQLMKNGGTQRLFIKLNPEHLGALRVELIQKDSTIIARILTSTANAKDMMESQLNGLKQAFHSQNIQVERIEISQSYTQADRSFNRDQQNQGQEGQQHQERQQEQQTEDFDLSFAEALLNTEA
ncbi:flagellar hook-length control protein FliK [Bacillus sp. S/N-304-OC-R1]|uniref:flagellar hook-length control protein FliK n=1 Tax=Bacillus sp. S/N-304-OC-R1 TaxID=2758034 RepID=UPI001C8EAA35|nr:flagellar hook-length control protein FliK [Bacillus sp. S/N-304-OC-R1]MBY0120692.1 flagellar hook-length control protein FliK [Bacillus sp. S/N-304-OC-R1]